VADTDIMRQARIETGSDVIQNARNTKFKIKIVAFVKFLCPSFRPSVVVEQLGFRWRIFKKLFI